MRKLLTEQKVLKILDIADFRHLTKDKVIAMASLLDRMDPEVAKKALEQFPEFASTAKEMLAGYKDTLDKGLEVNKESVQAYYTSCSSIIETLQKQLENENISCEERKYIVDKMLELSKLIGEKDTENKRFIAALVVIGAAAATFISLALASVLGGNTQVSASDIDEDEGELV